MKHFANFFISLLQTILGWAVISWLIPNKTITSNVSGGTIAFGIAVLIGLSWLVNRMRDTHEWWFLIIIDTLLSPIAIIRHAIGTIACIASSRSMNIEFTYDDNCFDGGLEPLQRVCLFLFYFYYDGVAKVTKFTNILTQFFIILPLAVLQTGLFWFATLTLINGGFPLTWLFAYMGVTLLSAALCGVRSRECSVSYYHGDYKFKNRYTGKTVTKHAGSRYETWDVTSSDIDHGWERTSAGYGKYFTGWMFLTFFSAHILAFTQAVAYVISLISSPRIHIISSYAKLDYEDFSCPFFQRIFHFYFSFVID